MANAGIKSTQAGTSLRSIMTALAGDVKFCGESIGEVEIQTTNADGSMRELSDILADCRLLLLDFLNQNRRPLHKLLWERTPCLDSLH